MNTKNQHLSYWETQSFLSYDVIIIGAGISGLSTAISLAEKSPSFSILVLEKSLFPSGASTKNAGFACFGSLSELLADIDLMGSENCLQLVKQRWNGLQKLRSRFTDNQLGYEALGGYELVKFTQPNYLARMDEVNALLRPVFIDSVFKDVSIQLMEKGFNTDVFESLIFNPFEGQIDTGKTIDSLWQMASKLGVKILTGANVHSVREGQVIVNFQGKMTHFEASMVVLTTNAFTKQLVPAIELEPGRGQVLITHPIENLKCKGTFHVDEGYFYFRNVGNRLLLGGGRNLDIKGEQTTAFGINPKIEEHLRQMLKNDLLPGVDFEIERQWSGIMAFGNEKKPILEWSDSRTLLAVRLGGMGMAIGSELGELASDLVLDKLEKN